MAKGIEDVQSYLLKMDLRSEEPREGIWVLSGLDGIDKLVITLAGPARHRPSCAAAVSATPDRAAP